MEKMRIELQAEGHNVQFIAVNAISALETQHKLVERCAFTLFQDTEKDAVWDLQNGKKDDFYIYDKEGVLADFLPVTGDRSVALSTDEGYANLKNAILAVLGTR